MRGKGIIFFALYFCLGDDFIEEKFYKVWLTLINGLGFKKYSNLINYFKTNKNIFEASKLDLIGVLKDDLPLANEILDNKLRLLAKEHLNYMNLNHIDIISVLDREYPYLLKQIYSPPICIYIKGNKEIFKSFSLGIVGCRDYSNYGKEITQKLSFDLAKNSVNIVSGLARGIDSFAHLGAIYAKGLTTAVLGNSLDTIYPKENMYLAKKIIESNGAIISEYPLFSKIQKSNFPARNRIISGISSGLVVVEAKIKSGSLITANFALEQGRDVFSVPRKYKFINFSRNK